MKRLIVLANAFPFGNWEPFLETELDYVTGFDAVDVISLSVRDEQRARRRPLPHPNMTAHPIAFEPKTLYLLKAVRALFDKNLYRELRDLAKAGRLTPGRIVVLFVFLSRVHHEAAESLRIMRSIGAKPTDSIVFYSYRFNYQPYLARLLRRHFPNCASVARAHRADLYEEFAPAKYLPLRRQTVDAADRIYMIADHGRRYLLDRFPDAAAKTFVSRLGTDDHGSPDEWAPRSPLRVVTCSTITPVKRLDLLVDALASTTLPIEWEHFGEGALRADVEARAAARLPDGVELTFRGFVRNTDLIDEYVADPRHVLVNVSTSEGVPVSIMEAMSTGTPIIATDVGGTGELVETGVNGILLPADPTAEEIRAAVESFATMDEAEYRRLREGARRTWRDRSDAAVLYTRFASEIVDLAP